MYHQHHQDYAQLVQTSDFEDSSTSSTLGAYANDFTVVTPRVPLVKAKIMLPKTYVDYSLDGRPVWTQENEDWLQDTQRGQ